MNLDQNDNFFNRNIFGRLAIASLFPFILCVSLASIHTIQSKTDYSFMFPYVNLLFYFCWGSIFIVTMKKYYSTKYTSKAILYIVSCLAVGFVIGILDFITMMGPLFIAKGFFISFILAVAHIILLFYILEFPISFAIILLCGLCLGGLDLIFKLGKFSAGITDKTNPNMIAFSIKDTLHYGILGIFLSYLASHKPITITKKPFTLPPTISSISFTLVALIPWFFLFCLISVLIGPHGDPAVGAFMAAMMSMIGIGLFSLLILLWGLSRINKLKSESAKRREMYLRMALGLFPAVIAVILFFCFGR